MIVGLLFLKPLETVQTKRLHRWRNLYSYPLLFIIIAVSHVLISRSSSKAGIVAYGLDAGSAHCPSHHWLDGEGCYTNEWNLHKKQLPHLCSRASHWACQTFSSHSWTLSSETSSSEETLPLAKAHPQGLKHKDWLPESMGSVQTQPSRSTGATHSFKDLGQATQSFLHFIHTHPKLEIPAKGEGHGRRSQGLLVCPDRSFIVSDLVVCPSAFSSSLQHQLQPSCPVWQIKTMYTVLSSYLPLPWLG